MYKKILYCIVLSIILIIVGACKNGTNSANSTNTTITSDLSEQTGVTENSQAKNKTTKEADINVNDNINDEVNNKDINSPKNSMTTDGNLSGLEIIINDQSENSTGTFNVGMRKKDVTALTKSRSMKIVLDKNNGTAGSTIICDDIHFFFDKNENLYEIYVYNAKNFQTSKGLKSGDSIQRLKGLYGKESSSHEEPDVTVYEYKYPTGIFFAVLDLDNKVMAWGVSINNQMKYNQKSSQDSSQKLSQDISDKLKMNNSIIKNQLLTEFKDLLQKVQSGDKSGYNLIMASDRANGLNSMFSLTEEENTFVKANCMELRAQLKDSPVYNGYSEDGVHFIAIISPGSLENQAYRNAVNSIRNKDDEFDFLSYISDASPERSLYLGMDIYAEDLTGKKEDIRLDGITLSNTDGEALERPIFGDQVSEILSKYNRKTTEKFTFKNKSWCTFVFDGTLIYQPEIVIHYNNKKIILQK